MLIYRYSFHKQKTKAMKKSFSYVAIAALIIATMFISSCSKKSAATGGPTADNMNNQTYRVVSILLNNHEELLPYTFAQVGSSDPQLEYMQCHIGDPAQNSAGVSSLLYLGSVLNSNYPKETFSISKTDNPTVVTVNFGINENIGQCVTNGYIPNDITQAGMIQFQNAGGNQTNTTCFAFILSSLNGNYKITGDDSNLKLEMTQQGMTIDILLEKQ